VRAPHLAAGLAARVRLGATALDASPSRAIDLLHSLQRPDPRSRRVEGNAPATAPVAGGVTAAEGRDFGQATTRRQAQPRGRVLTFTVAVDAFRSLADSDALRDGEKLTT
jgi:hypothetical protein